MLRYDSTPGSSSFQTAAEVEIWQGYFLKDRSGIARELNTYSLDNGPLQETADGKLVFRFTSFDWRKNIEALLKRSKIPYRFVREVGFDPLQLLLRKKIFVADDDPEIAFCLSTILESAGYQVKVSADGKAIMEGSYSWVDLFILDRRMPAVDGLELCRHLRSQSATRDTPVIMISAAPQAGDEAILAGANDYIEKPFHVHYLLNIVSRYIRNSPSGPCLS